MTRKNYLSTKLKFILTLIVVGILCFTMVFVSACGTTTETAKDPTYSYTETDNGVIKNTSFVYGTAGTNLSNFPKTSVTGWSLTKDSSAKSGVVDVTENGWKQLMNSLYSDGGILKYVRAMRGFSESDIIAELKAENNNTTPTAAQIKERTIQKYFLDDNTLFKNPGKHNSDVDNMVYMLNNYKSSNNVDIGVGSTQKLTSSTEIVLEKGGYAKVSVWVMTANLNGLFADKELGANIRISNSFNNASQADFGIFNINTNGEWKEYTFYVQADKVYETKFTLVLGLGYDYNVEGTVYFDDITVKHLTAEEFANENVNVDEKSFTYKSEDAIKVDASDLVAGVHPIYNMSLAVDSTLGVNNYISNLTFSNDYANDNYYYFTKSSADADNTIGGKPFDNSSATVSSLTDDTLPYNVKSGIKVDVKNASYSIKLDNNGANFELDSEEYAYISFFVKNNLNNFYSTNITINVFDQYNGATEKREAVVSLSDSNNEWTKCSLIVKNNFDQEKYTDTRSFFIEIIIGPSNVKTQNIIDFALGDVSISNPIIAYGATYQYEDEDNEVKTDNYDYYTLLSGSANGSTSLYAGLSGDYTADEIDSETYSLTVAPSDVGTITSKPATPQNYTGITDAHFYISEEFNTNYAVNTNENAGLINSKYLSEYAKTYADIEKALDYSATDKDGNPKENIQPLMIYNAENDCYGYISANKSISSSSYAKVSVKVRVYGGATAYIYLVDASGSTKDVMTFESFTANAEGPNTVANGTEIDGSKYTLQFAIDENMLDADGWKTVTFYVATGATAKNFRVEVWNGSRTGTPSKGYVFFNNITISTASAFTEASRWQDAFTTSGNPLFNQEFKSENVVMFERQLTDIEKQYNSEIKTTDNKTPVTYSPTYVWAKNDSVLYAVYNTIDPVIVNPYDNDAGEDNDDVKDDTVADPATFWLSFSSILLGVVLLLAIIMLVVKNVRRRHKANASDAKSHYKVVSRTRKASPKQQKTSVEPSSEIEDSPAEEVQEDVAQEETEEVSAEETEEKPEEQTLDSFVYGEVESFGEDNDNKTNE